jgi:hypothetical protein
MSRDLAKARIWYHKNKQRINEVRRDRWAKSKLIPECPRCKSKFLESKPGQPESHFVLCEECRAYLSGVNTNYRVRRRKKRLGILVKELQAI